MMNRLGLGRMTRRSVLRLSAAGALGMGVRATVPEYVLAGTNGEGATDSKAKSAEEKLYSDLLLNWCDGLVARQVTSLDMPAYKGGFLCAACGLIHGRCGDAVYPLLRTARSTGDQRYVRAAIDVHNWSEHNVSRPDGSWVNDLSLSTWQGITVFHAIAIAEALDHHGELLDTAVQTAWKERLARAAKFLDGFITIETGNVNYPVTASLAFVLCGRVLDNDHYLERGRGLAHEVLGQFSDEGLLVGEGHPLRGATAKGCRPVDLGYNVEESLPALAMYGLLMNDTEVLAKVTAAMK